MNEPRSRIRIGNLMGVIAIIGIACATLTQGSPAIFPIVIPAGFALVLMTLRTRGRDGQRATVSDYLVGFLVAYAATWLFLGLAILIFLTMFHVVFAMGEAGPLTINPENQLSVGLVVSLATAITVPAAIGFGLRALRNRTKRDLAEMRAKRKR